MVGVQAEIGRLLSRCMSAKGRFELPKWADVVKTSKARELPPMVPNLRLRAEQNVCFVV